MNLVVQKFGGSSLADSAAIQLVAGRIARAKLSGDKIVVVVSAMGDTTDALVALAGSISSSPSPRELDLLLSTGEIVSCTLVAMALREKGVDAVSMGGGEAGIITDRHHGSATIVALDAARVIRELDQGRVVIIAGFQGTTDENNVTTLGRGGSDTTAVAMAAALHADRCEIYTDVDGIYTANPRVVPNARKLTTIGYEEMLELASYGTKLPPRAVELAARYQVPVLVASSVNDVPGTLIYDPGDHERSYDSKGVMMEVTNKVSGVAYESNVARITVRAAPDSPGVAAAFFEPLASSGVSVDTIVQNVSADGLTDLSFTVERSDVSRALVLTREVATKIGAAECSANETLGNVSIVGTGMENAPGYAARMFRALSTAGINIEMITTSQIRITCVVPGDQVTQAVQALHDAFELDQE